MEEARITFLTHPEIKRKFKALCAELDLDMSKILTLTVAEVLELKKQVGGKKLLIEKYGTSKLD